MDHNMINRSQNTKTMHVILWIAQVALAAFMITGALLKFMPIEQIAAMMPWTGQLPPLMVRLLGFVDLLGALGLILPALLHIKPQVTPWTATGVIVLMLCAIIFHVSRGEAAVIGVNIVTAFIALFIAWGRFKIAPISSRQRSSARLTGNE